MNSKSFTLIELLVVISVIGLLASIVLVSLQGAKDQADIAKAQEFSHAIRVGLGADLVGEWRFEDGAGVNAKDSSGSDNNGTLTGFGFIAGSDWTDEGMFNKALEFAGDNDHVDLGMVHFDYTGDMTLSVWVKDLNKTANWARYLDIFSNSDINDHIFIGHHSNSGNIKVEYRIDAVVLDVITSITEDSWTFITGVLDYNGGSVTVSLYKNGEYIGSNSGTKTDITDLRGYIGRSAYGADAYFNGTIDEVQIYDNALSITQIQKLYAQGAAKHKMGYEF